MWRRSEVFRWHSPQPTRLPRSEPLADHLLALGPKRLGVRRIKGIGADAAAGDVADLGAFRHVAVLAIAAADLVGGGDDSGPDRGRGALRDGLIGEGRPARRQAGGVDLVDQLLKLLRLHVTA